MSPSGGPPPVGPGPLGLIAGNGRFPFLVADAARKGGRRVVAVAIREETFPDLASRVDAMHWVSLGQLGRCLDALKSEGVTEAVMAGQVKHRQLFAGIVPDLKMVSLLARLAVKNTDSLIGAVADVLAAEGIRLLPSTELLGDHMAAVGALTRRKPSKDERKDIDYGRQVARALAGLDLGQTVVVKDRAAVAVEAMEGTDEVIRRAGRLAGPGTTVVKVAKPRQDMRFDVPVVGAGTVEAMREAAAGVLALEAGKTLLLDKDAFLTRADEAGIAVWGMEEGT
ncbi:MAG TPA: UDP-2,3-diacylglucosamine diphosphatase LpxI [Vicinamibacteria bacterium]|nr:UDP-2,3-diacylglucosamine diphosphatase LpxI [Vicinamibacteria bacterium]